MGAPLSVLDEKRLIRELQHLRDNEPGLSQREIGRRLGISHTTVRRYSKDPSGSSLKRLSKATKQPVKRGGRRRKAGVAPRRWRSLSRSRGPATPPPTVLQEPHQPPDDTLIPYREEPQVIEPAPTLETVAGPEATGGISSPPQAEGASAKSIPAGPLPGPKASEIDQEVTSSPVSPPSEPSVGSRMLEALGGWFDEGAMAANVSLETGVATFMDAAARRLALVPDGPHPAPGTADALRTTVQSVVVKEIEQRDLLTRSDIDRIVDRTATQVMERATKEWGPGVGGKVGPEMMRAYRVFEVYHGLERTNKAAGLGALLDERQWRLFQYVHFRSARAELREILRSDAHRLLEQLRSGRVPWYLRTVYHSMALQELETAAMPF